MALKNIAEKSNTVKKLEDRLNVDLTNFKPIPFWSWNDKLEPEELCRQIDWMNENEIGGFFMHARGGLKTEYLSDEWMQCIEACANHAKEIGMNAWAYDENGWPSGFAGGKLLEDENNRDCYISWAVGDFDSSASVSYLITEDELIRTDSALEGEHLNLYIHIANSTADILNPEVVDKFIDLTHEAYKERFGEEFSSKIFGFFTDEPQYFRWGLPFTRVLYKYFEKEYGEDILDNLGLLILEKKGYRRFRYRYWKAMQHLMLESFAKKVYNWCEENGVKLTGHYVEECNLTAQMICCGGIMPFYKYMSIPGIDWLGARSHTLLPARQLGSVAAQYNKEQTLIEVFGCCGWQVTPKDLKRVADIHFLGGVNTLCHHLVPYAEHGQRKKDYPSHFSAVNPWVEREFADFNRYYTRLGYIMAKSKEHINVAMLHPIRTAYLKHQWKDNMDPEEWDDIFDDDFRSLLKQGVTFHLLDETLMAEDGFVKGKQIGCGSCSYDYLVLPHIEVIDASTEILLRQYVENGGKVLLMGDKPSYVEGEEYDFSYLSSNCDIEEIVNAQPFTVTGDTTDVYVTYRELDGERFMFIQNSGEIESRTVTFNLGQSINSFKKIDLLSLEECNISLTLTLSPGESVFVYPDNAQPENITEPEEYCFKLNNADVSFDKNMLTLDYVRYSTDGKEYSKRYPIAALFAKLLDERYEGDLYVKYEFDVNIVPDVMRMAVEDCGNNEFTLNGEKVVFTEHSDKEKLLLVGDISSLVKEGTNEFVMKHNWYQSEMVYYTLFGENNTESLKNCLVYDSELEPIYLSGHFGVYTKTGYSSNAGSDYVYASDFYIGEAPTKVSEPTTEGFPFFAGNLKTAQKINLDNSNVKLSIGGTWHVAYVRVNGKDAGKLIYERSIDISEFAVKGENLIEIEFVIGNRNLLGPHHNGVTSETASISPWSFTLENTWEDDKSPHYYDDYNFLKLCCK